jgi:hypothetical protein
MSVSLSGCTRDGNAVGLASKALIGYMQIMGYGFRRKTQSKRLRAVGIDFWQGVPLRCGSLPTHNTQANN